MSFGQIGAAIGSAAISFGASKFFGRSGGKFNPRPVSVQTPSATLAFDPTSFGRNTFALAPRAGSFFAEEPELVRGLTQGLRDLRERLGPAIGEATEATIKEIRAAEASALGNLRDVAIRRRFEGSRFAENQQQRVRLDFGTRIARERGLSILAEIESSAKLIQAERATVEAQLEREIARLGITSSFATNILEINRLRSQFQQELAAGEAAGAGKFFGDLAEKLIPAIFSGASGTEGTEGTGGDDLARSFATLSGSRPRSTRFSGLVSARRASQFRSAA